MPLSLSHGTGWRYRPDMRDYSVVHDKVKALNIVVKTEDEPTRVDLSETDSPVGNQGGIGSCTAWAAKSMVEGQQIAIHGKYAEMSAMFTYKQTRFLLGWEGDTGAFLRTTLGSLRLFGAAPERYWPYLAENLDVEPSASVMALADDYRTLVYLRHDAAGIEPICALVSMRRYLAQGYRSIFGFTVFNNYGEAWDDGVIPMPGPDNYAVGGHGVCAVGYDDEAGLVKFKNSWGDDWGDHGYGYLPYEYFYSKPDAFARDIWSALTQEWVDSSEFGVRV